MITTSAAAARRSRSQGQNDATRMLSLILPSCGPGHPAVRPLTTGKLAVENSHNR